MRLPTHRAHSRFALATLAVLPFACGGSQPAPQTAASQVAVVTNGPSLGFDATTPQVSEEGAAVPISQADPVWGSRHALVSVVVFGDFQCPFTGRILKTVQAIEEKYGPTDLRIVWKELPLPFHAQARPAAEAAEAVQLLGHNDAFWRFWDQALQHQTELSSATFEAWASTAGVELASFRRSMDAHAGSAKVGADQAVAKRLGVTGTPTFFINGVELLGAQPVEKLTALIDAELVKAKARASAGVTPDDLYTDLAKTNWKPPHDDAEEEEKEDTTTVWNVPVGNAPTRGPASALVTIVEFSDFQCPYCKRVEPTLKQVRDTYGDKVRIVWRDEPLPFHARALPAAELAREAMAEKGSAGFWAAHDGLFDTQPKLEDEDLAALAHSLGLNAARVASAIKDKRYEAGIQADLDLGDDVQASGTPHFFINGRKLVGAQPFESFRSIIDEEIKHGENLLSKGTPRAALYDTMMKSAFVPPIGEARQVTARTAAPFKGPAGAPVVIEEFADFQCPYCQRAETTLRDVAKTYGTKVKFVWRNLPLPFHAHARLAAEAAAEAQHQKGNAGFWAMHDKLFAHQGDADGTGLERAALDGYAREVGLDVAAFDKALDGHTHAAEVDEDLHAADAAQINGAPTFFVGGYYISGAQPFGKFRRLIDHVLASGPGVAKGP